MFAITLIVERLGALRNVTLPEEANEIYFHVLVGSLLGCFMVLSEYVLQENHNDKLRPPETPIDRYLHSDPLLRGARGVGFIYKNWSIQTARIVLRPWSLAELSLVALLEEVLYRGVLLNLFLSVASLPIRLLAVVSFATLFGLSHYTYGVRQVFLKFTYATLLSVVTIATGAVIAAVVAHLAVNVVSWGESKVSIKLRKYRDAEKRM
ncbi:CPBP family intramembrane glutamic endopeptidase [Actinomyces wuliandei]|uniref:CPBP family intramembrane glutamic endopeptidase n=1 Tax=Actinomyces wuliandei TaxID=2057743 RepID=UPI0015D6514F|nr:CPBP family intramembrane glutamic endopeptidase [Actinomyces wuliandei]